MALERDKRDQSYQYGRLLAVLDKMERAAYRSSVTAPRETNATRMWSLFVKRPLDTFNTVYAQLVKAYIPRLSAGERTYYDKWVQEIVCQLSECDGYSGHENDPLKPAYLLGYHLQQQEFYKKRADAASPESQEDDDISESSDNA